MIIPFDIRHFRNFELETMIGFLGRIQMHQVTDDEAQVVRKFLKQLQAERQERTARHDKLFEVTND